MRHVAPIVSISHDVHTAAGQIDCCCGGRHDVNKAALCTLPLQFTVLMVEYCQCHDSMHWHNATGQGHCSCGGRHLLAAQHHDRRTPVVNCAHD